MCSVDSSDRRWRQSCVDGHWQGREADACDETPDAAFEKYVRGRACWAVLPDVDPGDDSLLLVVTEDSFTLARAYRGEPPDLGWQVEASAYTTAVEGDVIWLSAERLSILQGGSNDAPSSLRVALRRIALNAWEVGLAELPVTLPWPSELQWVRCDRADPID